MEFLPLTTLEALAHQYGYGLIMGGIMLENAGLPLPGETIVLLGGFLAGSGELDVRGVYLAAIAGAILGDSGGYWLGRWGGMALLQHISKLFRLSEGEIILAKERFAQSADKAVFFGRFITFLRIFAAPLAGIALMPYPRFLVFNVAGAILWGVVMVSLAYFAGRVVPLSVLTHYTLQLGMVLFAIVAVWFALPWLQSRRRRH
ncbi:MAG: DedA family protein [Pseudanabaenaceae cyanobacterium]